MSGSHCGTQPDRFLVNERYEVYFTFKSLMKNDWQNTTYVSILALNVVSKYGQSN